MMRAETLYLRSLRCDEPLFLALRLPEFEREPDRLLFFEDALGLDTVAGRELEFEGGLADVARLAFVRTAWPLLLAWPVTLSLPEGTAAI